MLQRVSDFFGEELNRPAPAHMQELDDVEIAKLRSLGYVGTRAPMISQTGHDPIQPSCCRYCRMQFAVSGAERTHSFQDAVKTIEDIIQSRPDFYPAYQYLADLLNDMGDLGQAAAIARRGLEIAPNNTARSYRSHRSSRNAERPSRPRTFSAAYWRLTPNHLTPDRPGVALLGRRRRRCSGTIHGFGGSGVDPGCATACEPQCLATHGRGRRSADRSN